MLVGLERLHFNDHRYPRWLTREVGAAHTTSETKPAVVAVDGVDTETQFSGKAGLVIPVSDALSAYGEGFLPDCRRHDDFGVGGKLGVKYNF